MENANQSAEGKPEPVKPRRPLWVRFVHHAIRKSRECKANKKPESSADKATRRTAQATIAIAFFTLVLVVVSYFQWREIHRGGPDTTKIATAAGQIKGSADRSATAAHDFAVASQGIETKIGIAEGDFAQMAQNSAASMKATQKAMRLDQRAWMGLDSATGKPEVDKPFDIMLALKNTGRTPAKNVVIYSTYDPVAQGMSPDFNKIGDPIEVGFVSPNAVHFFIIHPSQGKSITKEQLPIFQTYSFFVHGILTYEDIFRKKHWFTYCLSMEPDGSRYDYCPNHNDVGDGNPPIALPKTQKPN